MLIFPVSFGPETPRLTFDLFASSHSPIHIADARIFPGKMSFAHNHDYYEFFFIRQGNGHHFTHGRVEPFTCFSLAFIPPDMIHCFAAASNNASMLLTNISFPANLFRTLVSSGQNHEKWTQLCDTGFSLHAIPLQSWEHMLHLADQLRPETSYDHSSRTILFKTLLFELFALYVEFHTPKQQDALPAWLKEACRCMEQKEHLVTGLSRFIELCGRSQEHVTRSLKKGVGITPTELINKLRLRESCKQLSETTKAITDIAYDSGFNNLSYFNTLFKQELGMSPRDFRKKQGCEIVPR